MDGVASIQFFKLVKPHILQKKRENPHILQKEKPHILQKKKNDKGILAIIVSKDIPHILVMLENLFLSK